MTPNIFSNTDYSNIQNLQRFEKLQAGQRQDILMQIGSDHVGVDDLDKRVSTNNNQFSQQPIPEIKKKKSKRKGKNKSKKMKSPKEKENKETIIAISPKIDTYSSEIKEDRNSRRTKK